MRTVISRAYYNTEDIEFIGEFFGDLQAIYPCISSSKILVLIYDSVQNRTKLCSVDIKADELQKKK
jgi:hypothetical protein